IEEYLGKLRWTSAPEARFAQQVDVKLMYGEEYADVSYVGLTDADFKRNHNRRYGFTELERMDRGRKAATVQHQFGITDDALLTSTVYWSETYRHYNRVNQINGQSLTAPFDIINGNVPGTNAHNAPGLLQGILDGTAN